MFHGKGNLIMTVKQVLLSFNGRINRITYWVYALILPLSLIIILFCIFIFFVLVLGLERSNPLANIFSIPATIILLSWVYINLPIHVKRFHDLNYSGWNYLWGVIPIFGPICILIVCGCLKGTETENNYGPVPAKGIASI